MDAELKGKAVLVTGGTSGTGRATAKALRSEGARVAVSYEVNRKGAEEAGDVAVRLTGATTSRIM